MAKVQTFESWISNKRGRKQIITDYILDGSENDLLKVFAILKESLSQHEENKNEELKLFSVFYNEQKIKTKKKKQRDDINNIVAVPNGLIISRAINGYCFGSPVKYVSKNTDKQIKVETLTEFLEVANNHKANISSTYMGSICGLGYKIVLPRQPDEIDDTPFRIASLDPTNCFVVKSSSVIPTDVLGVIINKYKNTKGEDVEIYECYSNYYQYKIIKDSNSTYGFRSVGFDINGEHYEQYPLMTKQMPLIEIPRNAFRIGDWELLLDLFHLKNMLLSNRADDIEQVVDYLLVLTNCKFESNDDKNEVLKTRLLQLITSKAGEQAKVDILKNPLDQNGVQLMQNYVDNLIEESAGIPNRAERSSGGQDTGRAVIFKSGFRDLENNAGLIIPEFEEAEKKVIKLCLSYANNTKEKTLDNLKLREVAIKFSRTLTDDIVGSSTAYSNLVNAGMDEVDALICSKMADDPAEVGARAKIRRLEKLKENQIENKGGSQ